MGTAFSNNGLARMHRVLAGYIDTGHIPGLVALVSRDGETHVEALGSMASTGGPAMTADCLFRLSSATKPVAAAAAMALVEDGRLRLDDPVNPFLPELSNRRVVRQLDSELDDTVPASRPITLRDLLTLRMGLGTVMAMPGTYPIQRAMEDAGIGPGPYPPDLTPDDWMRRLGELPLIAEPGESWMYDTSASVLGVLIARASGTSFGEFLRERILDPLEMSDTSFSIPQAQIDRLPPQYAAADESGGLQIDDEAAGGRFSRPPAFESAANGLVSTARDMRAFFQMLLDGGTGPHGRVLSRASVELMTVDHLGPSQRPTGADILLGPNRGWGFMMSVFTKRTGIASVPGRFGWDGGTGMSIHADPASGLIGVLLTQVLLDSPSEPPLLQDFWTTAYAALA